MFLKYLYTKFIKYEIKYFFNYDIEFIEFFIINIIIYERYERLVLYNLSMFCTKNNHKKFIIMVNTKDNYKPLPKKFVHESKFTTLKAYLHHVAQGKRPSPKGLSSSSKR